MKPRSKASTQFLLRLIFSHEIDNLPKKQNNKRSQNVKASDFSVEALTYEVFLCRNAEYVLWRHLP